MPDDDSLQELALEAMRGDADAIESLHDRFRPALERFFASHGYSTDAAELTQVAWIEVWRALRDQRYDPKRAGISTFVYAISWNVLLRQRRAARQAVATMNPNDLASYVDHLVKDDSSPEQMLEMLDQVRALEKCLTEKNWAYSLSEQERDIIRGCFLKGLSERAIGRQLQMAPSSVHARKVTALEKLRNCLEAKKK